MRKTGALFVVLVMLALLVSVGTADEGPRSLTEWLAAGQPDRVVQPAAPAAPAVAPESLTFYYDWPTFEGDFPGLPTEDYENGSMPYGSVTGIPHPLDEYSSNAYFNPGDILPGVAFWGGIDYADDELAALGEQFMGNPSKTVISNFFVEPYTIRFDPPVQAAGMDLQDFMGIYSCQIDVYDAYGLVGTDVSSCNEAGVFWGVASDADPITEIVILSLGGGAEGADNVAFGGGAPPEPLMYVQSIEMKEVPGRIQGMVHIVDEYGAFVVGAAVDAEWTRPFGVTVPWTATTNANGWAGFRIPAGAYGDYELCVQNVTAAGYVYDPGMNWEDCDFYYYTD